jgi:IS605 OrfB family transposase
MPQMQFEEYKIFTYQTRLTVDESSGKILDACAETLSHIERKLFADLSAGKLAAALKSEYLKKYQITARHFNAIRVQIEGKISSIKERQTQLIVETEHKIKDVQKTIQKLTKKNYYPNKLHQKKRLLFNLQNKQQQLKSDKETGKTRLCFGSKRLFRAQFDLNANGYINHEEWLKDWHSARDNSFFLMGSKDESSGNQSCTATLSSDGSLSLRIRLPNCLVEKHGKYLAFSGIRFKYGHQEIVNALKSCERRKHRLKLGDPNYKQEGLPISYRYKRDGNGWRVFVSVPTAAHKGVTSNQQGVIGIDVNANHLAMTETDRYGNPIGSRSIPLNTYGKSQNQTKALIGDACATLVEYAKEKEKSLIIEDLDFQKKKTQLKNQCFPTYSRMLSSLAYNNIKNNLKARAWKNGVNVGEVNPAFTSVIGRVKFSRRYGLSIHQAAALTIGRRYLKFSERVPRHLEFIPDGKCGHVALSLPVRNREKHLWSSWRIIDRELKTAFATHFRAKKIRSLSSKPAPETYTIPNFAGVIPARESVNTTARLACLDLSIFV